MDAMLRKLLDEGHEVTFSPAAGHEGARYDCFVTAPAGDAVVGSGDSPAAALREASPLVPNKPDPDACVTCGHLAADHDLTVDPWPCTLCGCREFEGRPPAPFTDAERLASLEAWAETATGRLNALEGRQYNITEMLRLAWEEGRAAGKSEATA